MVENLSEEDKIVSNASYLEEMFEIEFFQAYQLANKHKDLNQEELCIIYLEIEEKKASTFSAD